MCCSLRDFPGSECKQIHASSTDQIISLYRLSGFLFAALLRFFASAMFRCFKNPFCLKLPIRDLYASIQIPITTVCFVVDVKNILYVSLQIQFTRTSRSYSPKIFLRAGWPFPLLLNRHVPHFFFLTQLG